MALNIEKMLSQLSVEEKISLLAGKSTWRSAEVERLGIPDTKVSDGPSGARGEIFGNDQEIDRFHGNRIIPTRALREVYLKPFQMVVRDADPWCMMSAYNKLKGYHCDSSYEILTEIARREWGWEGVFMSDWGGTNSIGPSINAGLDLEMPGPPAKRTQNAVMALLSNGEVSVDTINDSVRRLLWLLEKAGRFQDPSDRQEICLNTPEQSLKLRHAARSGIVMLKNENQALPLRSSENLKKVAIVGPNAKKVVAGGGGSAYIKAPYWTSVFDSLFAKIDDNKTKIVHAVGAKVNSDDLYYISFGDSPSEITTETNFCYRLRTILTPKTSGIHRLSLASIGKATFFINDEEVATEAGDQNENATLFFTYGSNETVFSKELVAGREYSVRIEGHSHDRQLHANLIPRMRPMEDKFQGVRFGYEEHDETDLPTEAAHVCKGCDAAIVVVGRDTEWETEGQEIPHWELPGDQTRLIEEVSRVCPRTIVVIQAGTPVKMEPWVHNVDSVLYTWYQGQELGNAAADVICGDFNPSGRLPVTFPRSIEHAPGVAAPQEPGADTSCLYAEGIHVGHRWWDFLGISPLFPLGFGLSYSAFEISEATLLDQTRESGNAAKVHCQVTNLGGNELTGRHTVLAFFSAISNKRLSRPKKQLCGFEKAPELGAGDSCFVEVTIDLYELGAFDPEPKKWVIDAGSTFEIFVGPNAADLVSVGEVTVDNEISWVHQM
ncbi:glycoside hydrolase family 3 domain protein [Colletotrichum kahawae]|uniref:beta-glucosidase n=1 Tax=Colletotrichum kahawae TaxID=34407 RepID=A0AAE0D8P7_COLKA|nr:glycoside hydrolase family 3 domain protein [Colletotrichum kahawae]